MAEHFDYVITGGGIIGLSLARELANRKAGKILLLEKEDIVGKHASGRNSGVVHAGIYYSADSMKARFCVEGARHLSQYCEEHDLPLLRCGKVIVATKPENVQTLHLLLERAATNGVDAKKIDLHELKDLEPEARSHDFAIWSPKTSVIDSKKVLATLLAEVRARGVEVRFGEKVTGADPIVKQLKTSAGTYNYGFLLNTAGLHADSIAHAFGVGKNYYILPFKGLYWKSSDDYARKIQRLIYPAPDVNMPFLGVHITRTVDGKVLFGPTAIPALGRENYQGLKGLQFADTGRIGWNLTKMLIKNPGGFRNYALQEMSRYRSAQFFAEAQRLVHHLKPADIGDFYKVGIRAQLMNLEKGQLEMDFVIERAPSSLHVLNAISPAFTSSFAFATHLTDLALCA